MMRRAARLTIIVVMGVTTLCHEGSANQKASGQSADGPSSKGLPFWIVGKTFGFVSAAATYSGRVLEKLGSPFVSLVSQAPKDPSYLKGPPASGISPAGYSPVESKIVCASCGQHTTVRGSLPGLVIRCPSCRKALTGC